MSWILEGKRVSGVYCDDFSIMGEVILSRVKYGGKVQHTVKLDAPIVIFGNERDHILMDHDEITVIGE